MTGYWLLVLHLLGDYVIQSDWMAQEKVKRSWPAICHAFAYALPFAILIPSITGLLIIGGTHFIIDRWRIAKYLCYLKNFLSPVTLLSEEIQEDGAFHKAVVPKMPWVYPWEECSQTGFHKDRPIWCSLHLMVIVDNTLHLAINGLVLNYFGVNIL